MSATNSRDNETTPRPKPNYLPRLPHEFYEGDAVVLWTLTMFDRATGWLNASLHAKFREIMFHTMAREELVCPIYCLMPDHIHVVWMGLSRESDQFGGMAFLRTYLERELTPIKFQPQAHDHVLKDEERKRNAFAKVCSYVSENPVRAGFAARPSDWQFGLFGSGIPEARPLRG